MRVTPALNFHSTATVYVCTCPNPGPDFDFLGGGGADGGSITRNKISDPPCYSSFRRNDNEHYGRASSFKLLKVCTAESF